MTHDHDHDATAAIEAERAQIAYEVHDALLPLIVGAKAALESHLGSEAAHHADRDMLTKAFTWLDQAMQVGRQLLVHAHPPELSETTWTTAAQLTAQSCVGDQVSLNWNLTGDCHAYPHHVASAAYRIVVEAIRNATRHGQATAITIAADDDQVTITDNGQGFDPQAVSHDRFGIRSMKGRADLVGGELEMDTRIGGPTSVIFRIHSSAQ